MGKSSLIGLYEKIIAQNFLVQNFKSRAFLHYFQKPITFYDKIKKIKFMTFKEYKEILKSNLCQLKQYNHSSNGNTNKF